MSPKISRWALVACLALVAILAITLSAVAEEAAAAAESVAVTPAEAQSCEATPGLDFLETEAEAPLAMGCVTCPTEQHACTFNSDCDAYCSGCAGHCIPRKYSVCGWIEIIGPKVCQCL